MSVQTFKASHCGETFAGAEGAKALEAHMKAHRATAKYRGTYPIMPAKFSHKPTPWKAPKAPTDTRKLTEVLSKAEADRTWGWEGGLSGDWSTDERDLPVVDLQAGDVFMWNGRVYDVTGIEGDTLHLKIRKDRNYPEGVASLTFDQVTSKTETVSIIKRAA